MDNINKGIKPELESSFAIKNFHAFNSFSENGISHVKHSKMCYKFIYDPPRFWIGQDYIRALLLRFNLLPSERMPSVPPDQRRYREDVLPTNPYLKYCKNVLECSVNGFLDTTLLCIESKNG